MVKALEAYTLIWRKDCAPPELDELANPDNNKAFLAQTVLMTANTTLSIPAALRLGEARQLVPKRGDDQLAKRCRWPAARHLWLLQPCGGLQGRRQLCAGTVDFVAFFQKAGSPMARLRRPTIPAADAKAR